MVRIYARLPARLSGLGNSHGADSTKSPTVIYIYRFVLQKKSYATFLPATQFWLLQNQLVDKWTMDDTDELEAVCRVLSDLSLEDEDFESGTMKREAPSAATVELTNVCAANMCTRSTCRAYHAL